jgi:TonB-linked SusC/RagA family outer membrane protein
MKKIILMLFLFSVGCIGGYAQQITGNVADQSGMPLPGVNVNSQTGKSAVSDFDGKFSIDVPAGEPLTFTMIGYITTKSNAAANMKVVMGEEVSKLNEVVVVGYGTKKLGAITGSVSLIKAEEIIKTPAQSAIQAIQGKAAGVNIVASDEPGANPTIRIRGIGTILSGRDPLYVIDGVEVSTINGSTPLSGLNPNDIESINILKDASSLAIYGQKGANGVVIVTTKRGRKGEAKVSFNSYYGEKSILKKVKMADSYRYAYYNNSALGSTSFFNFNQPYNTDWLEEITTTGNVSNNNISISGANETTTYSLGASHYNEDGILLGTNYKRTNLYNKIEYSIAGDRVKLRNFINLSTSKKTPKPLSAFTNAYKQSPIMPVVYPNGRWGAPWINSTTGLNDYSGIRYNNVANPVAQLFNTSEQSKYTTIIGSLGLDAKIIDDLVFTSNFGMTAEWAKEYVYTPLRDQYLTSNPTATNEDFVATFGADNPVRYNKLVQKRSDFFNWNWDNYLTYKKEFGDHELTLVAGVSRSTIDNYDYLEATRYNVPEKKNYWQLDFSSDTSDNSSIVVNYHSTPSVSLSYFGRLEYAFKERYLLTGIIRREGLSGFVGSNKWATFPSISAGWIVSNEAFMKDVAFINNLKIRGGYGEVGNGNGISNNAAAFTAGKPYSFNGQIYPGSYKFSQPDPNLTWETMRETDFGLDLAVLSSRFTATIDLYDRKTDDIILNLNPPTVVSEGEVYVNSGAITNKGYEVTLRWQDNIGENFNYWIGGNFSQNENKVTEINSRFFKNFANGGSLGNGQTVKRIFINEPLGSFYVFEQIGYTSEGTPKYNDMVDGVAGLTDKDRINAGSYIPKYTYGINIGATYKGVDLSVDAYGVGGNKVYNGKKAQRFANENVEYDILDSFWSPSNPNAENPKPFNEVPLPSTYYIEDGAYLRINNITLGYTLPKMFEKLDKVRLYVTAINPFLFTDYSGYSPEIAGDEKGDPLRSAGIELDAYPTNKTFLVGANVNF